MSAQEIIEELPKLTPAERQRVWIRLAELDGDAWLEGEALSPADRAVLSERLAEYELDPEAGSTWAEVEERLRAQIGK